MNSNRNLCPGQAQPRKAPHDPVCEAVGGARCRALEKVEQIRPQRSERHVPLGSASWRCCPPKCSHRTPRARGKQGEVATPPALPGPRRTSFYASGGPATSAAPLGKREEEEIPGTAACADRIDGSGGDVSWIMELQRVSLGVASTYQPCHFLSSTFAHWNTCCWPNTLNRF